MGSEKVLDWNGNPLGKGYYADRHGDGLYYLEQRGEGFRVIPLDHPRGGDLEPWDLVALPGTNSTFKKVSLDDYMVARHGVTQRIMDFEQFKRPRLIQASSQE